MEVVLDDVEDGGDGELDAVAREEGVAERAKTRGVEEGEAGCEDRWAGGGSAKGMGVRCVLFGRKGMGRGSRHGLVDIPEGDDDGDGPLEKLVQQHGGCCRVGFIWRGGDARVVHYYGEKGVL